MTLSANRTRRTFSLSHNAPLDLPKCMCTINAISITLIPKYDKPLQKGIYCDNQKLPYPSAYPNSALYGHALP